MCPHFEQRAVYLVFERFLISSSVQCIMYVNVSSFQAAGSVFSIWRCPHFEQRAVYSVFERVLISSSV